MDPSPVIIPVYRAVTIVSTALSRDRDGDMAHIIVTDTTLTEPVTVVFELLSVRS